MTTSAQFVRPNVNALKALNVVSPPRPFTAHGLNKEDECSSGVICTHCETGRAGTAILAHKHPSRIPVPSVKEDES